MKKLSTNTGKMITLLAVVCGCILLLLTPVSHSQLPSTIKADDKVYRDYMLTISRQLGVTCNACHNAANFTSSEKHEFKVSKEHMRLTQLLIDNGFDGQKDHPKADCFMCHRGKLKPDFKEPFDPMTMQKINKATKPENVNADSD